MRKLGMSPKRYIEYMFSNHRYSKLLPYLLCILYLPSAMLDMFLIPKSSVPYSIAHITCNMFSVFSDDAAAFGNLKSLHRVALRTTR